MKGESWKWAIPRERATRSLVCLRHLEAFGSVGGFCTERGPRVPAGEGPGRRGGCSGRGFRSEVQGTVEMEPGVRRASRGHVSSPDRARGLPGCSHEGCGVDVTWCHRPQVTQACEVNTSCYDPAAGGVQRVLREHRAAGWSCFGKGGTSYGCGLGLQVGGHRAWESKGLCGDGRACG